MTLFTHKNIKEYTLPNLTPEQKKLVDCLARNKKLRKQFENAFASKTCLTSLGKETRYTFACTPEQETPFRLAFNHLADTWSENRPLTAETIAETVSMVEYAVEDAKIRMADTYLGVKRNAEDCFKNRVFLEKKNYGSIYGMVIF